MRVSALVRKYGLTATITLALAGAGTTLAFAASKPLYKDASAPVEARVDDLLSRMTLKEKVAQMLAVWQGKPAVSDKHMNFDARKMSARYPDGIGQISRPSDREGAVSPRVVARRDPAETVAYVNAAQKWAVTKTRLGIPLLFHEEGLHGFATRDATVFPQAIGLASTWDPELIREINAVTAKEISVRGVQIALSPVVDVARDPRWGRIEETFGEDPYLVSEMGVAAVRGLQGDMTEDGPLPAGHVYATLKHLTGHGQPESGENTAPAEVSERTLRENFFPPFEEAIERAHAAAVMPSYNEIDGVPSHINKWLLTDVLRGEWHFKGAVLSDYVAIDDLVNIHKVAKTREEAAIRALEAGVDADLPDGDAYATLVKAVEDGKVPVALIDRAVRHILALKFRAGLFEHPYADAKKAEAETSTAAATALARKAADRSLILLKNDGMLPLAMPKAGEKKPTIAVIGPSAAVARLGGYYGEPRHAVSILEGLKTKLGDKANVVFAEGVKITEDDDWWANEVKLADPAENRKLIAQAVAAAKDADEIILTLGDTEQTSREGWAKTHLGDRTSLKLVGQQQELFDALKALGTPIAVILINGRPASTVKIADETNALLEGWYLGEQGGTAVADVLFGDVNPGGKLPVTIPRNVGQLPSFYNVKPSARRGYLFDTTAPLFPFGYGLSYTTFEMGTPKLSAASIKKDGTVDVSVELKNTGTRTGDETVQIYVRDDFSSVTRPIKELKAFRRVTLKPGEAQTVTFTLGEKAFRMWNMDMKRVVEPGTFTIMAGPNSVDLKSTELTVTD